MKEISEKISELNSLSWKNMEGGRVETQRANAREYAGKLKTNHYSSVVITEKLFAGITHERLENGTKHRLDAFTLEVRVSCEDEDLTKKFKASFNLKKSEDATKEQNAAVDALNALVERNEEKIDAEIRKDEEKKVQEKIENLGKIEEIIKKAVKSEALACLDRICDVLKKKHVADWPDYDDD